MNINQEQDNNLGHYARKLSKIEYERINRSDQSLNDWHRNKLETDAKKNWDKFYLRNSVNFFKNRRWLKKEFVELVDDHLETDNKPILLELGCGVGNFLFPLIEEGTKYFIYACDFSNRAVDFVKSNELYDESKCKAFVADITDDKFDEQFKEISSNRLVDVISLIFVLSAINPDKMRNVLLNCYKVLKPNGKVILRDYGLYDYAQIRFDPKSKISDNFYTRIDGTRAFYFSEEFLSDLALSVGFEIQMNQYITKETTNRKEDLSVARIFIQSKFVKPNRSSNSE